MSRLRLDLSRRAAVVLAGCVLLVLAGAGGLGLWLHARPVLHIASSAQECVNAPDHVASLFSDDETTLIRLSNLDYTDIRVLRVEPASDLPGMFDTLLALSSDSSRLAYVTAGDELMDQASIHYLDVGRPDVTHTVVAVPQGLAPVRPAWSPDRGQLAYVVGRAATGGQQAGFEVWSARVDGLVPPQKVADLPVDVFAHGHSASLCWTAGGQIGLLLGVESALGPVGPSPLTGPSAASGPREATPTPAPTPARPGSPCGVPVFSQNDPSWRDLLMQAAGDLIGGYGCALTAATMLLNYYGSVMSPADLNACLGSGADPIAWQAAPACTAGRVQGGERDDFSWDELDAFLKAGKPVIVGMVRGFTGEHFVVVTQGGGGEADNYRITDPWDGSTTKTLGSYTNAGYNPAWIVSFDGPGKNCARLVPGGPPVTGVRDGGSSQGPVTITNPQNGPVTVQQVPTGTGGSTGPSPSPSASATALPSPSASPTTSPSRPPSPSASPAATGSPKATPTPKPTSGGHVWHVGPGGKLRLTDEGVYQVFYRHPGGTFPPRVSILKFTIDRTAPALSVVGLDLHGVAAHAAWSGAAPAAGALTTFSAFDATAGAPPSLVLDRPGKLRLAARDRLSGVRQSQVQVDGGAAVPYSNDDRFDPTLVLAAAGTHTVTFEAGDMAGNQATITTTVEVVDTSPTATPTPRPTPLHRGTPAPTAPPPPTPTPVPTPPCPTAGTISATEIDGPVVQVTWSINGSDCFPYQGTLVAVTIDLDDAPVPGTTRNIPVSGHANVVNTLKDVVPIPPNCIGCNRELYTMNITDAGGRPISFPTAVAPF